MNCTTGTRQLTGGLSQICQETTPKLNCPPCWKTMCSMLYSQKIKERNLISSSKERPKGARHFINRMQFPIHTYRNLRRTERGISARVPKSALRNHHLAINSTKEIHSEFQSDRSVFAGARRLLPPLLKEPKEFSQFPTPLLGYELLLQNTLDHLCEAVERASRPSPTEARVDARAIRSDREMVRDGRLRRSIFCFCGKYCANDKRGDFEKAIRICLQAAEYSDSWESPRI